MLDIVKSIINYIPRESLDDMLNVKVASVVTIKEKYDEPNSPWDLGGLSRAHSKESHMGEIRMEVVENKIYEEKIEKTSNPSDILQTILDRFKQDYKNGGNFNLNHKIEVDKLSDKYYLVRELMLGSNLIYGNSRNGPGNVVLIPEKYKKDIESINNMKVVFNPIEDDKIYLISKLSDMTQIKYHLITDSKIPTNRELKINKLLNTKNREINYSIMPVHGFAETIIVYDLV